MNNYYQFVIPGKPRAKQRARKGGAGHWYNPQEAEMRKDAGTIKEQMSAQFKMIPAGVPVIVNITAFFEPTKAEKTKKFIEIIKNEDHPYLKKPDKDNIDKYVCDVLSKIVFHDDNQVFAGTIAKFYTLKNAKTIIEVIW